MGIQRVDLRSYPYRGVLKRAHEEMCQNGRVIKLNSFRRAYYCGDVEVVAVVMRHLLIASKKAEEQKRVAAAILSEISN